MEQTLGIFGVSLLIMEQPVGQEALVQQLGCILLFYLKHQCSKFSNCRVQVTVVHLVTCYKNFPYKILIPYFA